MSKYYLDAGTTYSKIIEVREDKETDTPNVMLNPFEHLTSECTCNIHKKYYILPSKLIKSLNITFEKMCGHMHYSSPLTLNPSPVENEIIALANGCKNIIEENATVLDLGSRDAKWIRFREGKFQDMDWNTSCASSTGATVEMLLKFYDVNLDELAFTQQKFAVTCGIFGLEKIMDDISKGSDASEAISKFIHGIAYNAWSFAKKPKKLYLSGGFCHNKCFVDSLKHYCEVETLGRFVLCEGLIDGD